MEMMVLNQLLEGDEASRDLQKLLETFLAHIVKSTLGQKIRLDHFKRADRCGNGLCSLDDLQVFMLHQLERSHGNTESQRLIKIYQSCVIMAFDKAKASGENITLHEYRSFLVYFLVIATMRDAFLKFSPSIEDCEHASLSRTLFIQNLQLAKGYGFVLTENLINESNVESMLKLDPNGLVTFQTWVESCIQAEILSETELGKAFLTKPKHATITQNVDSLITLSKLKTAQLKEEFKDTAATPTDRTKGDGSMVNTENEPLHTHTNLSTVETELKEGQYQSIMETKSMSNRGPKRPSPLKLPTESTIHALHITIFSSVGDSTSRDLKDFLATLKPYTEKTLEGQKLRVIAFNSADSHGFGYCSFLDMSRLLLTLLKKNLTAERSDRIHSTFRLTFQRAYDRAKPLDRVGDLDYIMFAEFRIFIALVCIYAKMLEAFHKAISDKVNGVETKISRASFVKRYQKLHNYGFIALDKIRTEDDAIATFDILDSDGTGNLSFSDFASSLEKAEMTMQTDLGAFFETTKQQQLETEKTALLSLSISQSKSMSPRNNSSSSSPIKISSMFTLGGFVSDDLKDFVTSFIPYTEKTVDGQKLRVSAFKDIDVHNTGQCSMEELNNFVRLVLERMFDASRAEYLFHFFRPSYHRAYLKAKALDRSSNNDFIQVSEFRVYNAYLCIFCAMYDAFHKVAVCEGDNISNEILSLNAFAGRFHYTKGYGFAALDQIRTKVEARALFELMDENGEDAVGFEEFCNVLEVAEISNGTAFGEFLGGLVKSTPTFSPPPRLMMRIK